MNTTSQMSLFPDEVAFVPELNHQKLVCGGIYTEKDPEDRDPNAPYAICFGANRFHFIFDGMDHIENIVEIGYAHKVELVEGYALAMKKMPDGSLELQIRNSARKHEEDYIIWKCKADPELFPQSMKKYLAIFHK